MRRHVEEGIRDDCLLEEQHLVFQDDLVHVAAPAVRPGDIPLEDGVKNSVIAEHDRPRLLLCDADVLLKLRCKTYLRPIKIAVLVGVDLDLDSLLKGIAPNRDADFRIE